MHHNERLSWRKWPMVAGILASVFIIYGISLISRTHRLQVQIANDIALLGELDRIDRSIEDLALVHRVDAHSDQRKWSAEMEQVRSHLLQTGSTYRGSAGLHELLQDMELILQRADSVHREAMLEAGRSDRNELDAIHGIILQGAHKVIDRTSRAVHEQGISIHSGSLSSRWKEAQLLMITACILAVIFAWLVGVSNRLLLESRLHGVQLTKAKQQLERSNQELRETMLSKEEKEMMIKEIHHRVKNNLQIVKSLIRFQMDQVQDPKVNELFNECVNRVSAMALVHEQTYLSKDLANVDVNTYLRHLTRDLCQAYTIHTKLQLDIRINVPTLGVDTLIPLGLLINEIISNSLKYAFTGRTEGTIFVHMNGDVQNGLHLRIGDNGVGLPDRSGWKNPQSLGMELIHTLTDQLDSRIELADGPGTVYELTSMHLQQQKRA